MRSAATAAVGDVAGGGGSPTSLSRLPLFERREAFEEPIPLYEQDLDLGRNGVQGLGLARNGLSPPIEEVVHHR